MSSPDRAAVDEEVVAAPAAEAVLEAVMAAPAAPAIGGMEQPLPLAVVHPAVQLVAPPVVDAYPMSPTPRSPPTLAQKSTEARHRLEEALNSPIRWVDQARTPEPVLRRRAAEAKAAFGAVHPLIAIESPPRLAHRSTAGPGAPAPPPAPKSALAKAAAQVEVRVVEPLEARTQPPKAAAEAAGRAASTPTGAELEGEEVAGEFFPYGNDHDAN